MADAETTAPHALPPAPRVPSTPPAQNWRRDLITAAWSKALDAAERAQVAAYLNAKYGLAITT